MNYLREPYVIWFEKWRQNIRKAKEYEGIKAGEQDGYCRAAAIAQSQYVMYRALRLEEAR